MVNATEFGETLVVILTSLYLKRKLKIHAYYFRMENFQSFYST